MAQHKTTTAEAMIVRLAQTGDQTAFAQLVARYQSHIRQLMRRACRDTDLADDLAQQTFLAAWRHISRLQDPLKFGGWLRQIAVNQWLQYIRKQDPLADALDHEDHAQSSAQTPGMKMDLDRALSHLTPMQRMCIILSYHEGLTHQEIARQLSLPLGTLKSHIVRGSEALRHLLAIYQPDTKETSA